METVRAYRSDVFPDFLKEQTVQTMRPQPDSIESALHLFSASHHLERIANHATNITEDVIYLIEDAIPNHQHE
jgi:phosphate transport system protein